MIEFEVFQNTYVRIAKQTMDVSGERVAEEKLERIKTSWVRGQELKLFASFYIKEEINKKLDSFLKRRRKC